MCILLMLSFGWVGSRGEETVGRDLQMPSAVFETSLGHLEDTVSTAGLVSELRSATREQIVRRILQNGEVGPCLSRLLVWRALLDSREQTRELRPGLPETLRGESHVLEVRDIALLALEWQTGSSFFPCRRSDVPTTHSELKMIFSGGSSEDGVARFHVSYFSKEQFDVVKHHVDLWLRGFQAGLAGPNEADDILGPDDARERMALRESWRTGEGFIKSVDPLSREKLASILAFAAQDRSPAATIRVLCRCMGSIETVTVEDGSLPENLQIGDIALAVIDACAGECFESCAVEAPGVAVAPTTVIAYGSGRGKPGLVKIWPLSELRRPGASGSAHRASRNTDTHIKLWLEAYRMGAEMRAASSEQALRAKQRRSGG
jgi:hypothetical protein